MQDERTKKIIMRDSICTFEHVTLCSAGVENKKKK